MYEALEHWKEYQKRDELAIELMQKLDNKYNMNNVISLDEYVYEYYNVLTTNEKVECFEIIEMIF